MLSKFIVSAFPKLLELSLWLIMIVSLIAGWGAGPGGLVWGVGGALVALIVAFIVCTIVFGALLTLLDIRQSLRTIESKQKTLT